jgi:Zn-finger nucleic acid-binding protein
MLCTVCGGSVIPDYDLVYNIEYDKCFKCGKVYFRNDGFGKKENKIKLFLYTNHCKKCGAYFESNAPNKKHNCEAK